MRVWPPLAATLAEAEMTAEDGMTSEEAAMRLDAVLAGNEGPSAAPSDSEQDARSENVAHHDIHRDPDIHSGCENGTSSENAQSSSRPAHSPSGQSTERDAIPLDMQQDMLSDWLLGGGREKMHAFIDEHWSEIIYAMWAHLEDEHEVRLYQKQSGLERRRGVAGNMAVAAILLSGG